MSRKILKQKDLEAKATEHFKTIEAPELFATSDGQFFYIKSDAQNHAGDKGNVFPFKREDFVKPAGEGQEANEPKQPTVKEIEAAVLGIADITELEKMAEGETRKGALTAINTRIEVLKAAIDPGKKED